MTTTDAKGIVFLQDTDDISPFHTLINVLQAGTSNALDAKTRITRVANLTERNALTGASPSNPLYVHRSDAGFGRQLEVTTGGSVWFTVGSIARARFLTPTASGSLGSALNIVDWQGIEASPFGTNAYTLRVNASMAASLPPGLGVQIDIIMDDTVVATNKITNAGGSSNSVTVTADKTTMFSDALAHTVRVVLTPLAGSITVLTGTTNFVEIHGNVSSAL